MRVTSPETKASVNSWMHQRGFDGAPPDHPDRKQENMRWAQWFLRQPNPEAYKNMAERDPNRLGAPGGWKTVYPAAAGAGASGAQRSTSSEAFASGIAQSPTAGPNGGGAPSPASATYLSPGDASDDEGEDWL